MSETDPINVVPPPAKEEPTPEPAPVDETDWKAEARKWEQRAKSNVAAADELTKIKDSQKSEIERATEALQAAQTERDTAKAEALRFRIASKHSITDEDAELFLTGIDEETLTRQAERLAAHQRDLSNPRSPRPDINQGRSDVALNSSELEDSLRRAVGAI